ncbi:13560_t:CDS:1, partial [Racocetra persica]
ILEQHHRKLNEFDLPTLDLSEEQNTEELPRLILEELNYVIDNSDLEKIALLNESQKIIFDKVIERVEKNQAG